MTWSAKRIEACSARLDDPVRTAPGVGEAGGEELGHGLHQVELDLRAEQLGHERGEDERVRERVDLHEVEAAPQVQHGGEHGGEQREGAVLEQVARGARAARLQPHAVDAHALPGVAQRLAVDGEADDVDLVAVVEQRLDLPPHADVVGEPVLADDEDACHAKRGGARCLAGGLQSRPEYRCAEVPHGTTRRRLD